MPTVAEELAALRAKGSVKAYANNLTEKTSSGGFAALSTPEAEEAALRAKRECDKLGSIRAKEILSRGSKGAAEASAAQAAQLAAARREELERKAEASEILKKGGSGYSRELEYTMNQAGKKKAEWEKKNEAKKLLNRGGASTSDVRNGGGEETVAVTTAAAVVAPKSFATTVGTKANDDDVSKLKEGEVDDDDDDVMPELETSLPTKTTTVNANDTNYNDTEPEAEAGGGRLVTNRQEKKIRKMMMRLGMRPVPGIARMTLKVGGGRGYFFIDRPDVFFGGGGGGKVDTYVVFGEARQGGGGGGNGSAQATSSSAKAQQAHIAVANATASSPSSGAGTTMPNVMDKDENNISSLATDDAVDEDGVDAKDVDLVMSQASCSRVKAVAALKESDGDLVNAIMALTT
ncbi:hypothetical protein ACHAXA_002598 [Cyclostephanos tholiformis]|uniref:NAC-A/B domain-containing protein n=1 Tax=Cyclostephanos tholiformis TaxID=382380 RepID=A0ABD3SBS4_9STRA